MANYSAAGLQTLLEASVQSLLLAGVVAIAPCLLAISNDNLKHRAWTALLIGMLLLPALAAAVPSLSPFGGFALPRLFVTHRLPQSPLVDEDVRPPMPQQPAPPSTPVASDAPTGLSNEPVADPEPLSASRNDENATPPSAGSVDPAAIEARAAAAGTHFAPSPWPRLVMAVYLLGLMVMSVRLCAATWTARRLIRGAVPIARPRGCRARLAATAAVCVPVTVAVGRPCILLPGDWVNWDEKMLAAVLAHEQAHIDRRDHLTLWVAQLNRCLYWFHPLAWYLCRRLAALAERCCDDSVIAALDDRTSYAQHLLTIAHSLGDSRARVVPLGISMARTSRVETRIAAILDEKRPLARHLSWLSMAALVAVAAPLVILAAGLRAEDQAPGAANSAQAAEPTAAAPSDALPAISAPALAADPPAAATAKVRGRVIMPDGFAAEKATVRLFTWNESISRYQTRSTSADVQGNFEFDAVPAGKHRLVAWLNDLALRSERHRGEEIEVNAEHPPAQPIELKLSRTPSIKVHVTSKSDGAPVADALVRLRWTDTDRDYRTDAQGDALLPGLTREVWHVEVQAKGFAEQMHALNLSGGQTAELTAALDPGGSAHGIVRDAAGQPVAGAGISVRLDDYADQIEYLQTGADGRYHFDFLPLGVGLKLNISRDGYQRTEHRFQLAAAGPRDVAIDLTLPKRPDGGSIRGIVTDEKSQPITGAEVSNHGRSSKEVRKTSTDAGGRFVLHDVYEGVGHELIVKAAKFVPLRLEFQPGMREKPAEVTIKLAAGHRIRGRVQDADGKPIAYVEVYFAHGDRGGDMGFGGHGTTDSAGRFQFDSLPPGPPFRFVARGYSETKEASLPLDGDDEVIVTMQPQAVVRGRAVDARSGEPIKKFNARVTFSPDSKSGDPPVSLSGARVTSGEQFDAADGQFLLDDFVEGSALQVSVDAAGYARKTERRVVARAEADAPLVEFRLTPIDPATLTTVRGTILNEQSQPIAGAELRLIGAANRPQPRDRYPFNWEMIRSGRIAQVDGVSQFLSTTSDEKGNFQFDRVQPADDIELAYFGDSVCEGRRQLLERMSTEERNNLKIVATTPAIVRGKIDRQTLPNVSAVAVSPVSVSERGYRSFTAWLDWTDTSYEIRAVPPGSYELQVLGERTRTAGIDGFTLNVIQRQPIELRAGQTVTVDLGFDKPRPAAKSDQSAAVPAGAAAKPNANVAAPTNPRTKVAAAPPPAKEQRGATKPAGRTLTGRVVDSAGRPIADALVSLPLRMSALPAERWQVSTKTDGEGKFALELPEAWLIKGAFTPLWTVWAYAPGYQLGAQSAYKPLHDMADEPIEIKLAAAAETAIRVVDSQGAPVAGATVELWHVKTPVGYEIPPDDIGAIVRAVTDQEGRAKLPAVGRDALHRVKVTAEPFGQQEQRVESATATAPERAVRLRATGRLEVRVRADEPALVRNVPVFATSQIADDPRAEMDFTEGVAVSQTDVDGRIVVPRIAVGSLRVMAAVDPALRVRPQLPERVEIRDGETTSIEIPLVKGTHVRGVIREKSTAAPVAGALLRIAYGAPQQGDLVRSDADGKFETYVLPGPVRQQAIMIPDRLLQLGEPWNESHSVAASDELVELPPIEVVQTREINGKLVDQRNAPLAGLQVNGLFGNRRYGFARTGDDGRFTLHVPPELELTFQVWPEHTGPVDAEIVLEREPLVLRARVEPKIQIPD